MIGLVYLVTMLVACSVGIYLSTKEFRMALFAKPRQVSGAIDSWSITPKEIDDKFGYRVVVQYRYLRNNDLIQSSTVSFSPNEHSYTKRQVKWIKESISENKIYTTGPHRSEIIGTPNEQTSVLVCAPWFHLSSFSIWLLLCWLMLVVPTFLVALFGTQNGSGDIDVPFKG